MKRKILFLIALAMLFVCAFAITVGAKDVYLEPIPEELKAKDDVFTHFVVFEEPKYFVSSGSTISNLNTDTMDADMAAANIDKSKIGTEYLTRFNFPAYIGENLITYVNLNSMKTHAYFKHVCGYIQLEGTVNKVHDMNECVRELRCIDFGENSQVTSIPLCFANQAKKMASVKNFPRNLTSVGNSAFDNCYRAFKGEFYLNATTIGSSSFNNAISHVTHLILGPNVQSIGTQALTVLFETQHHNEIPVHYASADIKPALVSIEFQCDVSQIKFATQGNNTGAFYFPISTGRAPYEKLETIILSHPNNAKNVTENSIFNDFTASGITILFNDSDGLDDYVTANHDFSIVNSISYKSFDEIGVKTMVCSKCGATANKEIAEPLFKFHGYSAPENGRCEITIGYTINKEAIKEYESKSGKIVKYGVFAVLKDKLGANDIFDENGNATTNSIVAEVAKNEFISFELKISGFTDANKNVKLAMGAYVSVTDKEVTTYSYMQGITPNENESYFFVSYNDIVNPPVNENEAA